MRLFLLALSSFALASNAFADGYPRQQGVDALHYSFHLSLRDDTDEIEEETVVLLRFHVNDLKLVSLDLMRPSTPGGRGMSVGSVTYGGAPLAFAHKANRLDDSLPDAPKEGERRVLSVRYRIAHQWFGDSVTKTDWADVWLSEGFATYYAMLFIEQDEGREAFLTDLRRSRAKVFSLKEREPGLAVIHANPADTSRVLNDLVYQKGGWVLHMLQGRLGTNTFDARIRDYYATYRDKNATTDDFRKAMEGTSCEDLSWFYRQWLNRPGHPVIEGTWRYVPAAKSVVADLAQTQSGEPYRLPLELGLQFGSGPENSTEKFEIVERRQQFRFLAAGEPSRVALDPNSWTLMKSRLVKP